MGRSWIVFSLPEKFGKEICCSLSFCFMCWAKDPWGSGGWNHGKLFVYLEMARPYPIYSFLMIFYFGEASMVQAKYMWNKSLERSVCSPVKRWIWWSLNFIFLGQHWALNWQSTFSKAWYPSDTWLGTYLCMPLLIKNPSSSTDQFLVERTRRKLSAWKERSLSLVGPAILIQMSANIANYAMQMWKILVAILDKLSRITRFFYGENLMNQRNCML